MRQNEVPDQVWADRRQQGDAQPEPAGRHGNVGRRAADVGIESRDLGERGADVLRKEIHAAAAKGDYVIGWFRQDVLAFYARKD